MEHKPIPYVTSAMMAWWFNGNIDGDMVWNGVRYPRYLLWHPRCVSAGPAQVLRTADLCCRSVQCAVQQALMKMTY